MIVADTNLVSDYLVGHEPARECLERYESRSWAVPAVVLYESTMGAMYGHIPGDSADVRATVRNRFDVLETNGDTVRHATELQRELHDSGTPLGNVDALIAASAREWGATLVTNDGKLCDPAVSEHLDVARYDRSDGASSTDTETAE